MNMFEISYEMRNTTEFMVGSEETEPAAGWPYDKILSALTLNSQMSARDLSVLIVNEYGKYYSSAANIATQSCLDFSAMESAAKATNALADALLNELPHVVGAISLARSRAQKVGARVAGATGVSIYFPESGITYLRDYADLQFSKEGKWKVFLDEYFNV